MSIRINDWFVAGNAQKTNSDWNATEGYAQILNKPLNLVHTDGNETISGTKTFASIVFAPTPATNTEDTSVATAAYTVAKIQQHSANTTAHPDIRLLISNLDTKADNINNDLIAEMQVRSDDDDNLQAQIDALSAKGNIADIVGTYADLMSYDTSRLYANDIIKVLQDETRDDMSTYYKWVNDGGSYDWDYIGSEAPTYTKTEIDNDFYNKTAINNNFVPQVRTINSKALSTNLTFTLADFADDVGYALDNSVVHLNSNETINGVKTFTQTIQGTAYRALWGDLAEYYLTDEQYPKGTLVQFGGEKEITLSKNKVNAVITSEPGFILNGEQENSQAIALIGRVPVRVIGKVKKFDKIALSYIDGVGCVSNESEKPIGIALEDKSVEDEGLVLCSVKIDF